MIWAVEVTPPTGLKYLACVTERKYLANFVLGYYKECRLKARLMMADQSYPVQIHEIDDKFVFKKKAKPLKRKTNIVYFMSQDFFPEDILNDEMGSLDHEHHGEIDEEEED